MLPPATKGGRAAPGVAGARGAEGSMILGVGTDLLEVARFERRAAAEGHDLLAALFLPAEIEHCRAKLRPHPFYAARFAAKEALFKALGTGVTGGLSWHEVEVVRDRLGKPTLRLTGRTREAAERLGVARVHVSLTHTDTHAAAVVVLEGGGRTQEGSMKEAILEYIRNEYLDEEDGEDVALDETTPLISGGIVDSFSLVSLKRFLEKSYDISIPDAEATPEAFDTVTSIVALVEKHRRG